MILDTNVFVAAGFNPRSASARILAQVRAGELRMIWNDETRREIEYVLGKIKPLRGSGLADLFREEDRYSGETSPGEFDYVPDPDDRKFAALASAAGAVLITNDDHLLSSRGRAGFQILTPGECLKL